MTRGNIKRGWRGSGLYPFNPLKVTQDHKHPIPPAPTTPPFVRIPLHTIQSEYRDFIATHGPNISTPIKRRWSDMEGVLSNDRMRLIMIEARCQELQALVMHPSERQPGSLSVTYRHT